MNGRHGRQARLAGVGVEGQAHIARAAVAVRGGGVAAEVAARYLAGAGVGRLRVGDDGAATAARSVDSAVHVEVDAALNTAESTVPIDLRDPAAQEVGRGARQALRCLRRVLEAPSTSLDGERFDEVEA